MATAGLLWALDDKLDRVFITVLKGYGLAGAEQENHGPWEPFRKRDEVRELEVTVHGEGAPKGGVLLRGVEMRRPGSRNPRSTLFVTNGDEEDLPPSDVAAAYLSRWPYQEQVFRNARNGGGAERSHGHGGRYITHVAFETKVEKARRKLDRAHDHLIDVERIQDAAAESVARHEGGLTDELTDMLNASEAEVHKAEQAVVKANNELVKRLTMPREIYARDTGRDNLMTCLKLGALMLLEFVLKEYFGDLRMEWRNDIEQFHLLAVTVRTTRTRILHQIEANPRQPQRMEQLRKACDEINSRRVCRGERVLKFEVIDPAPGGS